MMTGFFHQPTWPVAIAALAAASVTVVLQFLLHRRSRRFAELVQQHAAVLGERNAETAAALTELKRTELAGTVTARLVDQIEGRAGRLHDEFAELLALLDARAVPAMPMASEHVLRILTLCRSISLTISPRGDFAETLNCQLGHVRQAVRTGQLPSDDWAGLIEALRYNAWKVVDGERDRIPDSLREGRVIDRRELEPIRWPPSPIA